MIHLDFVDRGATTQTVPMVCMHCEDPTCAEVCPADAIKQNEDGIVQSALKPRCIGCSNCVLACPFGVPKYDGRARPDDEVRHVLRPHLGRPQADVRVGVPEPGAVVRHARASSPRPRTGMLVNEWQFGRPGRAHQGPHRASTNPARSTCSPGAAHRAWQDDPFGLEEESGDEP